VRAVLQKSSRKCKMF